MAEHEAPLQPVIRKRRSLSIVWLIPLLTMVIGLWLIVKTISERGPEITITFRTAEGIEAGKTPVKYKDVKIGIIESVRFSRRFDHVVLTARLDKEAEVFLHRDTRFWVVRPRLSLRGASGLGTLISGSYIEIDPGHGAPQYHFIGLDEAPLIRSDSDGVRITLLAEKLGSLSAGSPVYYQGIRAGEVLGYELANDQHSILIHAFVRSPFDAFVHGNSHFWNVSGIDVSIGADGVRVRTPSLVSMIYGGIAFDAQQGPDSPDEDISSLVFTLYNNHDEIVARAYTHKLRFVVFFDGSVRGLEIGAPVEFKGIRVGQVADIRLEFDNRDDSFRIPVIIELEPERIIDHAQANEQIAYRTLKRLIKQGLRAQLQTGSLLTGRLYVALDMHPDTPASLHADAHNVLPEIPSVSGGLEQIQTSLHNILARLEKVETDKIGQDLETLLHGASAVVNKPELQQSVVDLQVSLRGFRHIMEALDTRAEPLAKNLDKALESGHRLLDQAEITLHNLNAALKPGSPMEFRMQQLSRDLSDMARSIRSFVDLLERHPNALIIGKPKGE